MANYPGLRQLASALQTAIDTRDDQLIKHTVRTLCAKTIGDDAYFKLGRYEVKVSNLNGLTINIHRENKWINYTSEEEYFGGDSNDIKGRKTFPKTMPIQNVVDEVLSNKMELLIKAAEKELQNEER